MTETMSTGDSYDIDRDTPPHGAAQSQPSSEPGRPDEPDRAEERPRDRVTMLPPGAQPRRQLHRVGVKIGRKVLEFQRPIFQLGPLHVYVAPSGRLRLQWKRPAK